MKVSANTFFTELAEPRSAGNEEAWTKLVAKSRVEVTLIFPWPRQPKCW